MTKESDCNKCILIQIQCPNDIKTGSPVLLMKICVIDFINKILDLQNQNYTVEDYENMVGG